MPGMNQTQAGEPPDAVKNAVGLKLVETIGPFDQDLHHVQGLAVTDDYFYITSVDKDTVSGSIYRINRKTNKVEKEKNLAKPFYYHTSGIQLAGGAVFIAIALYEENTGAFVYQLDPMTFEIRKQFKLNDHIGAVASDGKSRIYGGNWDSKLIYEWDMDGKLIAKHHNTVHAYQDIEFHDGFLVGCGSGFADWIDVETWKVVKSFQPGPVQSGNDATREGISFFDGKLWFLPDDGPEARIYIYEFTMK